MLVEVASCWSGKSINRIASTSSLPATDEKIAVASSDELLITVEDAQ